MTALAFTLLIAVAAAADWLSVAWHAARERGHVTRAIVIAVALEILNAAPLVAALAADDWRLLIAGVIGSAIGTGIGVHRAKTDR